VNHVGGQGQLQVSGPILKVVEAVDLLPTDEGQDRQGDSQGPIGDPGPESRRGLLSIPFRKIRFVEEEA